MTSRPEEDDGTKPWKELNEIIYGYSNPKKTEVCKSHLVIHPFSICLDLFGVTMMIPNMMTLSIIPNIVIFHVV